VCALVALYRPGPMGMNMHTEYAERKNGRKPVVFDHPDLEDVLAPTYGIMVYQEQLMRVAQKLAGYSLAEADSLRKATGKKIRELIQQERSKFVAGCVANGHDEKFAERMFDFIEPFADYSFNKSHAFGYGFVAYQTAYLKAHHPVEYLAALLTSVKGDKDKTAVYLNECRTNDIPVLVPDVNRSESDFAVYDDEATGKRSITFGLSAVRNVGEGIVALVVEERAANGPYADFVDFCERVDPSVLNKRAVESLIKAGGFDSLGHPRRGLLLVFEQIIDTTLQRRRERDAGVMNLFDGAGAQTEDPTFDERPEIPDEHFDKRQRLVFEKEMLGLYVSDHPLMGAQRSLARHTDATLSELREQQDGAMRMVGGVVNSLKPRYTKRGDYMATFVLEDLQAAVECMVFPKTMQEYGHLLEEDAIVCVKARLDLKEDDPKLIAMEIHRPDIVLEDEIRPVVLKIPIGWITTSNIDRLRELLMRHPGEIPVIANLQNNGSSRRVRFGDDFRVEPNGGLLGEVRVLLGPDCIAG